jgi:hypothetical protein
MDLVWCPYLPSRSRISQLFEGSRRNARPSRSQTLSLGLLVPASEDVNESKAARSKCRATKH